MVQINFVHKHDQQGLFWGYFGHWGYFGRGQSNPKAREISTMRGRIYTKYGVYKSVASNPMISRTNTIASIGKEFQAGIISKMAIFKKKFAKHYQQRKSSRHTTVNNRTAATVQKILSWHNF